MEPASWFFREQDDARDGFHRTGSASAQCAAGPVAISDEI